MPVESESLDHQWLPPASARHGFAPVDAATLHDESIVEPARLDGASRFPDYIYDNAESGAPPVPPPTTSDWRVARWEANASRPSQQMIDASAGCYPSSPIEGISHSSRCTPDPITVRHELNAQGRSRYDCCCNRNRSRSSVARHCHYCRHRARQTNSNLLPCAENRWCR